MNSKKPSSLRERILAQIEQNEVQMHSRFFFMLKVASAAALAAAALLISVFIGNLLFFTLRINGHDALLSLGGRGFALFVQVFPWWLLALDILLIVALVWVVRHFQFGYRRPAIFVFLAVVLVAFAAGFALDHNTPLNDHLLRDADDGGLPSPLRSLYQGTRHSPPPGTAYRGTITSIGTSSLSLYDPDLSKDLTVFLPAGELTEHAPFSIGQNVFIVGNEQNGFIQAFDIHPIDPHGIAPREEHGGPAGR